MKGFRLTSAFCLDEDEDGDRITVRSDEELKAMFDVSLQHYRRKRHHLGKSFLTTKFLTDKIHWCPFMVLSYTKMTKYHLLINIETILVKKNTTNHSQ